MSASAATPFLSEQLPKGDLGGNQAFIRIRASPLNLHSFRDALLGTGMTAGDIEKNVGEIEPLMKAQAVEIHKELGAHQSFESRG